MHTRTHRRTNGTVRAYVVSLCVNKPCPNNSRSRAFAIPHHLAWSPLTRTDCQEGECVLRTPASLLPFVSLPISCMTRWRSGPRRIGPTFIPHLNRREESAGWSTSIALRHGARSGIRMPRSSVFASAMYCARRRRIPIRCVRGCELT